MIQIGESALWVGGRTDFEAVGGQDSWARVNVAKTVHQRVLGRAPTKTDPNYIFFEAPDQRLMSVNWVDAPSPRLFDWTGVEGFIRILNFIGSQTDIDRNVLVSCDQGISRAPTVGLLYSAKRLGIVDGDSFESARIDFLELYPAYQPKGVGLFASEHWPEIV